MNAPLLTQTIAVALLHFVWQGCVAGLGLAILLQLIRRAQYRYLASVLILCALVVVFGLTVFQIADNRLSMVSDSYAPPAQAIESGHKVAPKGSADRKSEIDGVREVPSAIDTDAIPQNIATRSENSATSGTTWELPVVIVWFLGISFFGFRFLFDLIEAQKIRRRSYEFPTVSPLYCRLSNCLHQASLKKVRILESAKVVVPLAMGWLKPVVIFPAALASRLSPQQVEAILWHELAHIRRHDYLVNLIQSLVEVVFFFHPVVWWISRQMRIEREHCCYEWATRSMGSKSEYASALTALEEWRSQPPVKLAVAANGSGSDSLLSRIGYLCGKRSSDAHWPMIALGSLGMFAAVSILLSIPTDIGVAQAENKKQRRDWLLPVDATIEVSVVDENREPVPNAKVWIWRGQNAPFMKDLVIAHGRTDADGKFKVESRMVDISFLCGLARNNEKVGFMEFHSNFGDDPAPLQVEIELRDTESVTARISLPDGQPATGVPLRVFSCFVDEKRIWDSPELPGGMWQAQSDANGSVTISGIPKGAQILLYHEDDRFAQFGGDQKTRVYAGSGIVPELTLEEPRSIKGQILAPDGTPVDYAWLLLSADEGSSRLINNKSETYDPDGRFLIPNLPSGKYRVTAFVGYNEGENWMPTSTKVDLTELLSVDVGILKVTESIPYTIHELDAETRELIGEPIESTGPEVQWKYRHRANHIPPPGYGNPIPETIMVNLTRGQENIVEIFFPPAKSFSGTVLDDAGNPVDGAQVRSSFPYQHEMRYFTTEVDGKFLVSPAEPANAAVVFAWQESTGAVSQPVHRTDSNREGIELILRKDTLAEVSGRVVDDEGKPILQAVVQWEWKNHQIGDTPFPMLKRTDKNGEFTFPKVWSEIPVELNATLSGHTLNENTTFTLQPGEHREIELRMTRSDETVNGIVRRHDGSPAVGVLVTAGDQGISTRTDENGAFSFTGLPKGGSRIAARDSVEDYHTENEKWVSLGGKDAPAPVEIELPAAEGAVSGVIRYDNGQPLMKRRVAAIGRGRDATTDENGRFEISGLMGDWMTLAIFPNGNTMVGRETARIKTGQHDLEITIPEFSPSAHKTRGIDPLQVGDTAPPVSVARWFGNPVDVTKKPNRRHRLVFFWEPSDYHKKQLDIFSDRIKEEGENWPFEVVVITKDTSVLELEELMKEKEYSFPIGMLSKRSQDTLNWNTERFVAINTDNEIVFQGFRLNNALDTVRK